MIKLGIDIVDLKDPQLKVRNERALQLIRHPDDALIEHPQLYWLLWSAKEAVFKCHREAINFSPTRIPVQLRQTDEQLLFSSDGFQGMIEVTESYLMAVCSNELENISYEVTKTEDISTSTTMRDYIVNYFNGKGRTVTLGSDELNLPVLLPGMEPISISHHYHMSAFAFIKSKTP